MGQKREKVSKLAEEPSGLSAVALQLLSCPLSQCQKSNCNL